MAEYALEFDRDGHEFFSKLDKSARQRIWKKLKQLKQPLPARHLKHGFDYFVAEVGQYRVVYRVSEERKAKIIYFIGDHKEYEQWLGL